MVAVVLNRSHTLEVVGVLLCLGVCLAAPCSVLYKIVKTSVLESCFHAAALHHAAEPLHFFLPGFLFCLSCLAGLFLCVPVFPEVLRLAACAALRSALPHDHMSRRHRTNQAVIFQLSATILTAYCFRYRLRHAVPLSQGFRGAYAVLVRLSSLRLCGTLLYGFLWHCCRCCCAHLRLPPRLYPPSVLDSTRSAA